MARECPSPPHFLTVQPGVIELETAKPYGSPSVRCVYLQGGQWTEITPSNTSLKMRQLSDKTTLSAGEEIQVISFSGGLRVAGGDSFIMNTSAAAELGRVVIRILKTELNVCLFFIVYFFIASAAV